MKLMELEATLSLNSSQFSSSVDKAKASMQSLGDTTASTSETISSMFKEAFSFSAGQLMADGFQQGLGFIKEFTSESLTAASDMQEVRNVIDTTFGEEAASIYAWANGAKEAFGMSTVAALEYAGEMGAILKTQGFSAEETRDMSKAVVELAADYASFRNMNFSETFDMLRSGLRGETESIERLGLSVHVATMIDFLGLTKETDYTKGMTQAEQIRARFDYIMEKSSFVQGDFAKTSDSFANQLRILNTNVQELETSLGEKLLPIASSFLQFLNSFFKDTGSAEEAIASMGQTMGETYATINDTTENALALVNALAALEDTSDGTEEWQSTWDTLLSQLSETMPGIDTLINSTTGYVKGGTEALKDYALQWKDTQQEIAIAAALQGAQNEVMQQAQKLAALQADLSSQNLLVQADAEREEALYARAREYLGYDESYTDLAPLYMELMQLGDEGDIMATTLMTELDLIAGRAQEIESLESQIAAMEIVLDAANAKYAQMETSLRKMQQGEGEGETDGGMMSEATSALQETTAALATLPAEMTNAAREGFAAGVGGISVTGTITTGNVVLNTGALVGQLTPTLNLKLGTIQQHSMR